MVVDLTGVDNDHGVLPLDMINSIDGEHETAVKKTHPVLVNTGEQCALKDMTPGTVNISNASNCTDVVKADKKSGSHTEDTKSVVKQATSRWLTVDEYEKELKRDNVCGYIARRGPFKGMVCASSSLVNKADRFDSADWRCSVCIGNINTIRLSLNRLTRPKSIEMKHLYTDDCYEYSYGSFTMNGNTYYLFTERCVISGCPEYPPTKETVDTIVTNFINGGSYSCGVLSLECDSDDFEFALAAAGLPNMKQLEGRSINLS
jgi:hypothetical protein